MKILTTALVPVVTIDRSELPDACDFEDIPEAVKSVMTSYTMSEFTELFNDSDFEHDFIKLNKNWVFSYYKKPTVKARVNLTVDVEFTDDGTDQNKQALCTAAEQLGDLNELSPVISFKVNT